MGESYAGVYVPTLAERILVGQKDFPINLKGIALGNGMVHEKLNIETSIRYAYGHGIVDERTWNALQRDCCGGCIDSCELTEQTLGKTPWKYDRQIAGFKTVFEGLTFITVRGAGHKAPRQRAPQMFYAIQQFLLNHPI
uniref:Carboxypeptidase n=1 Tax=Haemonchus contortus TaxID=6289 RepID=A0A7I5E7S1_HAECO